MEVFDSGSCFSGHCVHFHGLIDYIFQHYECSIMAVRSLASASLVSSTIGIELANFQIGGPSRKLYF